MRLAFLLCSPDINGGTYVIFEYASRLSGMGHEVVLLTQEPVAPARYAWHPEASSLTWMTIAEAGQLQFDCTVATWWESPFLLQHLQAAHCVYFVQSIESRFFPKEDPLNHDCRDHSVGAMRSDNSYLFAIPVITEATWIKNYLQQRYNHRPYLVRNGIRKDIYSASDFALAARTPGRLRVLVEGPVDVFHKNVPRTIELCRQSDADEIWLLTSSALEVYPGVDRIFSQIPVQKTPEIYRSCDVLVKLSYVEGMFGPPLEMFHCGGTAIVYDVTGHDEYIVHGENSLVVRRDDEDQVFAYLNELRKRPEFLQRLCVGAAKTAELWPDWSASADQFADCLAAICTGPPVSRDYLRSFSEHLLNYQHLQLQERDLQRFAQGEKEGADSTEKRHNFVQLYYNSPASGSEQGFSWKYYEGGRKTSLHVPLMLGGDVLKLRIDPSVRIGIVLLYRIRIISSNNNRVVADLLPENGWQGMNLAGTCKWLEKCGDHWLLECYGNDPQLFLPDIVCGPEDRKLSIEIVLKEGGFASYLTQEKRNGASNVLLQLLHRAWRSMRKQS